MSGMFELDLLIQEYIDEYCDAQGRMPQDKRPEFIMRVVRMVRYDVTFEDGLLKNTTDYIEQHYPNIELWEAHQGEMPAIATATEQQFDEQTAQLRKNFSHERVQWLSQVGMKLYGKKEEAVSEKSLGEEQEQGRTMGESKRQQSQSQQRVTTTAKNQQNSRQQGSSNKGLLGAVAVVIVGLIAFLIWK